MNPIVSIITPMFNNEEVIEGTISSVLNQSFSNWELLLIDDFSTDRTVKIVTSFLESDERIKLFKHQENKGAAETRNSGTKEARGDYIAFLDADDLWLPHKLERQLEQMKIADVCYGSYELINQKGKPLYKKVNALKTLTLRKLMKANYVGNLTGIYNCKNLGKIYTKDLKKRQDWLLWIEALKRSNKPAIGIQDTLAYYRVNEESLSSNKLDLIKYNFNVYYKGLGFSYLKSSVLLLSFFYEHFFVKRKLIKDLD